MSSSNKVLSSLVVLLLVAAIGTIIHLYTSPSMVGKYTEFYILGSGRKAADYPIELKVGDRGTVVVGIVNREHESVSYRVEVMMDGVKSCEVGPISLRDNGTWDGEVSFIATVAGENQKVEFLLYKQEQTEIYQSLYLWVDVMQ